jgi:hypothetical protein
VRANLLWQDKNDWREFKSQERRTGALAVTYRPFKNTEIRFDGEYGDVDQVLVQQYPANEAFRAWEAAGAQISRTYGQAVPRADEPTSAMCGILCGRRTGELVRRPHVQRRRPGQRARQRACGHSRRIGASALGCDFPEPGWTGDFHYFNAGVSSSSGSARTLR